MVQFLIFEALVISAYGFQRLLATTPFNVSYVGVEQTLLAQNSVCPNRLPVLGGGADVQ
jgi:hypothetical protein